jgi:acetyl esterase/lipase
VTAEKDDPSGIDWEDAFANASHIPGGAEFPARWKAEAEEFRARTNCNLDIPYGDHPREKFDLFVPESRARGLAVFIHGGFWLAFGKSDWSGFAAGALARGWAVAIPSYVLAPEARIGQMTQSIGRAITTAAQMVEGPVRLAGHSAGGHLVTRMVCDDSPLPQNVAGRIERVVSISGLHDLRPLQLHSMNERLGLDPAEAAAESPCLHRRLAGNVRVTAWVGAAERPEFLRQSALLSEAWSTPDSPVPLVAEPGRHHFNVIDGLRQGDHPLTEAFAGDSTGGGAG